MDTERRCQCPDRDGPVEILLDPSRVAQADAALFDPASPHLMAQPVDSGGRGAAWFVQVGGIPAVLRHYRRGGLMARLSRSDYLWSGFDHTRAVREFRLLAALRAQGLPVPAPLAVAVWRRGWRYRAAILIERIPAVRSLAQRLSDPPGSIPWPAIGAMLARVHAAGVWHADLNAHNVLIDADGAPWLIDFDRGEQRAGSAGWRDANLARLARSLHKLGGRTAAIEAGLAQLRAAYDATFAAPAA